MEGLIEILVRNVLKTRKPAEIPLVDGDRIQIMIGSRKGPDGWWKQNEYSIYAFHGTPVVRGFFAGPAPGVVYLYGKPEREGSDLGLNPYAEIAYQIAKGAGLDIKFKYKRFYVNDKALAWSHQPQLLEMPDGSGSITVYTMC